MVSSYNAWQQGSPLPEMPERNPSALLQLVSRMAQKENRLSSVLALSFRPALLIPGIIMSVKSR